MGRSRPAAGGRGPKTNRPRHRVPVPVAWLREDTRPGDPGPGGVGYQSWARVSLPLGVQAAAKVHWLMVGETVRTLPSPRPASMPPTCGVCGRRASQAICPRGANWYGDAGAVVFWFSRPSTHGMFELSGFGGV